MIYYIQQGGGVVTYKYEKLKGYRMAKGYSQTELAELIGISRNYYNQIENGNYTPSVKTAKRIADVLGKNLKDFFSL